MPCPPNSLEHAPLLTGARVMLRALQPDDAVERLRAGRAAEFVWMCGGDPRHLRPMTPADAQAWYARLADDPLGWAIVAGGRCIGHARLHHVEWADFRARYAIGIFDKSSWGQGYGTEATRLVLGYAFDRLGLHRVDLRVLEYNTRAIACYQKCGFVREGLERESALVAGQWYSDVIMSILAQEYRRLAPIWAAEAAAP